MRITTFGYFGGYCPPFRSYCPPGSIQIQQYFLQKPVLQKGKEISRKKDEV